MPALPGRRPPLLLELDLTHEPVEVEPDDLVGRLRTRNRPRLRDVLRTLHEAGEDSHVRGLVVRVGSGLSWATMQEIRGGIERFVASGKPAYAWAETLGEGNGTGAYVLATACSEVWLQPVGELGLLGVAAETTFLRGTLDKLGVEPQLSKRHEYKNAADRLTRTEFTPEHREAVDRLTASAWEWAVATIAAARGLDEAAVTAAADRAPLSATQALEAGLIDRLGYRDEVYAAAKRQAGEGAQLLFADQWRPHRSPSTLLRRHKQVVALVDARGEIVGGRSSGGPRGRRLGSDTVCAALRAARADENVRAVLLRVDSPGGSAVASDTIWREVVLTRESGRPVVVSMGGVAGSGGYYIACPADVIVAQPATITGSIGVFGGKVVVADLLERVGLSTGAVAHGRNARMFSSREGFSDEQWRLVDAMLDRVYADFVAKVASGRRMDPSAVDAVARGRVWSGSDASGNGLVDVVGGMRDAARIARERAGLAADAPVRPALHIPPLARLGRPKSSEDPRAIARVTDPLGELTAALGLPSGHLLRMPAITLR